MAFFFMNTPSPFTRSSSNAAPIQCLFPEHASPLIVGITQQGNPFGVTDIA